MKKLANSKGRVRSFFDRVKPILGIKPGDFIDRSEGQNAAFATKGGGDKRSVEGIIYAGNYSGVDYSNFNKAVIHQGLPYDIKKVVPRQKDLPPTKNEKVVSGGIQWEILTDAICTKHSGGTNPPWTAKRSELMPTGPRITRIHNGSPGKAYVENAILLNRGANGKFHFAKRGM